MKVDKILQKNEYVESYMLSSNIGVLIIFVKTNLRIERFEYSKDELEEYQHTVRILDNLIRRSHGITDCCG